MRARDPLDERDDPVAVDASVRAEQARGAGQSEHPADLRLGGRASVAAGAEPHVGEVVELHRLGREALVEQHPQERRRGDDVAERLVRAPERDPAPLADRLEPVAQLPRLEQPERVERARHPGGTVVGAGPREGVLQHAEVEGGVVRHEHGAVEKARARRRRSRRTAVPARHPRRRSRARPSPPAGSGTRAAPGSCSGRSRHRPRRAARSPGRRSRRRQDRCRSSRSRPPHRRPVRAPRRGAEPSRAGRRATGPLPRRRVRSERPCLERTCTEDVASVGRNARRGPLDDRAPRAYRRRSAARRP